MNDSTELLDLTKNLHELLLEIRKAEVGMYETSKVSVAKHHVNKMVKAENKICDIISQAYTKGREEGYKKGYTDKGIEELLKHENDKGNQI